MPRSDVTAVVVVVPAHDEEESVGRCVSSVRRAAAELRHDVDVTVTVVADACSDRTAVVAGSAGALVLDLDERNVGSARRLGCEWAVRRCGGRLDRLWIATTDADSIVPPHWLVEQLRLASHGADAVVGTIVLEPDDARRHAAWSSGYAAAIRRSLHHPHVHGANLGFRGRAYLMAGGFPAWTSSEDRELVRRLEQGGAVLTWATHVPVLTSARHRARAPGGVAQDLATS